MHGRSLRTPEIRYPAIQQVVEPNAIQQPQKQPQEQQPTAWEVQHGEPLQAQPGGQPQDVQRDELEVAMMWFYAFVWCVIYRCYMM